MILRGFLWLFYHTLKPLVRLYQVIFFPFTVFRNAKVLDFSGPGILVSNHPSTMVDPLHVVSRTPRQSFFLANSSLFKHPVSAFLLGHLYCIPIQRPGKDQALSKVNNDASFRKTYDHLANNGVIYIAPEGTSDMERHLRPIKTGTARIALGAEADNGFALGLHIYPVGLNYENPTHCGSRLYMEAGTPICVADWQARYEADPTQAVSDLTDHVAECIQALMIDADDAEQDQLLYRLERVHQHNAPLPVAAHYDRAQRLLAQLKHLRLTQPDAYAALATTAEQYRSTLRTHGLTDRGISQAGAVLLTPVVLLGWPLWLYGRLNNLFPYEIPRWLTRKLNLYVGYTSTVKILAGAVTFPLFYTLQYQVSQLLLGGAWPWVYLLSLPVSGIGAWGYARHFQPRYEGYRWRRWQHGNPQEADKLMKWRGVLEGFGQD